MPCVSVGDLRGAGGAREGREGERRGVGVSGSSEAQLLEEQVKGSSGWGDGGHGGGWLGVCVLFI